MCEAVGLDNMLGDEMKTKGFVTLTEDSQSQNHSDIGAFPITFPVENFGFVEKGANGQGLVTLSKPNKTFWVKESHDRVVALVAQALGKK